MKNPLNEVVTVYTDTENAEAFDCPRTVTGTNGAAIGRSVACDESIYASIRST
jgi:hypothetical protein